MAPYKLAYSVLFLFLFALFRGVMLTSEIGPALLPGSGRSGIYLLRRDQRDGPTRTALGNHLPETREEPDPHDLPEMDPSGSVSLWDCTCSILCLLLAETLPDDRANFRFRVRRLCGGSCGNCFVLESDLHCCFQSGKEPVGGDRSIGASLDYDQFHTGEKLFGRYNLFAYSFCDSMGAKWNEWVYGTLIQILLAIVFLILISIIEKRVSK